MRRLAANLLILFLSQLLCPPAFSQGIIASGTPWSDPHFTRIDASFDGDVFHARWDISRCDCGDIHILAEETLPGEIRTGEQLLLNGNALLVRGYEGHQGELSALLDSPVLMMQLTVILLQRVEPAGPASISDEIEVDVAEPTLHLELDSGIAFGLFPAPWSVSGSIVPGETGKIAYDLRFEFEFREPGVEPVKSRILLNGLLDFAERNFPVQDSEPLDGWKLGWLTIPDGGHAGLKPGTSLAEFRETL